MSLAAPPPEHCPGTSSDNAGKANACAGCPNQQICASTPKTVDPDLDLLSERLGAIKNKVLVLSGKGGVGKSTFSAQLSFALALKGAEVGLLDVDICGPSIPKMLGLEGEQIHSSNSGWSPVYVQDNLGVMSVGFMLDSSSDAVIWRGPRKNGLIKQFLRDVDWGGSLDYLVIDTPPGTSDEHLSITGYIKAAIGEGTTNPFAGSSTGAVIITTPQDVALIDVRKEINFCKKIGLPIIGVVENMSMFICPKCKGESKIFAGAGGAEAMAKDMGVPFLGRIPLDPTIAKACDSGKSYVEDFPDSEATKQFMEVFKKMTSSMNVQEIRYEK